MCIYSISYTSCDSESVLNNLRGEFFEGWKPLLPLQLAVEEVIQKRSGGGRGVKEKSLNRNSINTSSSIGVSTESNDTMNKDTLVGVASVVKEGVTPSVVDMTVEMEKISSLEDTTILGSFPPLFTPVTTTAGNALGKSLYANVTCKPSGKKLNIRTLFTPRGNGIDVVVSMESIQAISERFANTTYGFLLGKRVAYPFVANYVRNTWGKYGLVRSMSSYARVMIKLRAGVELKDNIVMAMPKIIREGHYICNVRVEYEWKPPRCSGWSKNGFKPQKEYIPVPKKTTASFSSNKKKGVEPTIEVSNFNPFEVLNSVDNDVELGTNGGTTNLINNMATSSGSSFMNVDNSSTSTTPIIDKIGKFEELITSGKATLVDEVSNPLKKVKFLGDYDSEDEVASIDNDMAHYMALERVGFSTQSLLKQWRDSYGNDDYDEDPYDDDMYEVPYHGIDLWLKIQVFYDHVSYHLKREIDHAAGGKLRDKSAEESCTSDCRLIELKNQVQYWMEAHIAPKQSSQVNKIAYPWHKFIAKAYTDLDLPMNVMSLAYYNAVRSQGYEDIGLNFVRIGMDMHVFVGNMSYVMDFTILDNVEANIDPSLSQVVLIILSDDDARKGCERVWDLESRFYKDVEKLSPLYRRDIEMIDLEIPFGNGNSVTEDGVT
ncbi:hypothetical protein Tco_1409741 [Tanacetum coccineum]